MLYYAAACALAAVFALAFPLLSTGRPLHICTPSSLAPQVFRAINPKAVTRNELYGYLHPQTREWREGLISVTFRDMANSKTNRHQWIVLDGDIDAEWIEVGGGWPAGAG